MLKQFLSFIINVIINIIIAILYIYALYFIINSNEIISLLLLSK